MNYKVIIAIKGEADLVNVVSDRKKAQARIMKLVDDLKGTYTIGVPNVDAANDTITVPLYKEQEQVGTITGSPAKPANRPLTGKFKHMQLAMSKLTSEFLAKDLVGIIGEILKGAYQPDAEVAPGLRVRDLLEVNGFFMSEELVTHMAAMLTGRYFRRLATEFKIDLTDRAEVSKCAAMMDISSKKEYEAAKIAIEILIKKEGTPSAVDEAGVQALLERLNNFLTNVVNQ